jgi:hypothetical protein
MTSSSACPVLSLHTLWYFLKTFWPLFALFMIGFGGFLLVLGGKHYKITMFLSGELLICTILMIFLFTEVLPDNSPFWTVWLSLFVTLGIASGFGVAAQHWPRIGVLLIGACVGGLLGALSYSLFFYIFSSSNPLLGLYLTISFCSIVVAVLSMIFFDSSVIICTGIFGSYLFVRVITIILIVCK